MINIFRIIVIGFSFAAFSSNASESVYGPTNIPLVEKSKQNIRFFGSAVELKSEHEQKYRELHADVWPEVIDAIKSSNIHNYHIYLAPLNGKKYLFSFFEYHGNDMKNDFAKMQLDDVTREKWWPLTDSYQEIIPGTPEGEQWLGLESLMHIK